MLADETRPFGHRSGGARIALLAGVGFGVAACRPRTFDKEAKAFLEESGRAMLARRDKQELLDRGTPELRASATPEQLATMFETLAGLGPVVEYEPTTRAAHMDLGLDKGFTVSAEGDVKAQCQHGNVVRRINAVRRDGHWMIDALDFQTEAGRERRQDQRIDQPSKIRQVVVPCTSRRPWASVTLPSARPTRRPQFTTQPSARMVPICA